MDGGAHLLPRLVENNSICEHERALSVERLWRPLNSHLEPHGARKRHGPLGENPEEFIEGARDLAVNVEGEVMFEEELAVGRLRRENETHLEIAAQLLPAHGEGGKGKGPPGEGQFDRAAHTVKGHFEQCPFGPIEGPAQDRIGEGSFQTSLDGRLSVELTRIRSEKAPEVLELRKADVHVEVHVPARLNDALGPEARAGEFDLGLLHVDATVPDLEGELNVTPVLGVVAEVELPYAEVGLAFRLREVGSFARRLHLDRDLSPHRGLSHEHLEEFGQMNPLATQPETVSKFLPGEGDVAGQVASCGLQGELLDPKLATIRLHHGGHARHADPFDLPTAERGVTGEGGVSQGPRHLSLEQEVRLKGEGRLMGKQIVELTLHTHAEVECRLGKEAHHLALHLDVGPQGGEVQLLDLDVTAVHPRPQDEILNQERGRPHLNPTSFDIKPPFKGAPRCSNVGVEAGHGHLHAGPAPDHRSISDGHVLDAGRQGHGHCRTRRWRRRFALGGRQIECDDRVAHDDAAKAKTERNEVHEARIDLDPIDLGKNALVETLAARDANVSDVE